MPLRRGFKSLLAEAERAVKALTAEEAAPLLADPQVLFVDVRDVRELDRDGMIPGAFHAPRGMLEFWIDPESPYHKPVFAEPRRFVFYCSAGWRSALSAQTVQEMGLENVWHLAGGFAAWREAGKPVVPRRPPERGAEKAGSS